MENIVILGITIGIGLIFGGLLKKISEKVDLEGEINETYRYD